MRRFVWWFFGLLLIFNNSYAQSAIDHWESLVLASDTWRYFPGTSEPPADWREINFDDNSWLEGPGGIGYGDDDDGTIINPVTSVYLRLKFSIHNLTQIEKVLLLSDFDDAYVAYLNGVEIARNSLSGNPPTHDQFSDSPNEALMYQGLYPEEIVLSKNELDSYLINGENILAIQVHNSDANSSDLSSNFYLLTGLNVSANVYREVPSWFKNPAIVDTSNLPIIKIYTSGSIPDEPKIKAHMGIIDNGMGNINHIDDPFNDYDGNIGIELRGSSSQMFPKKQYAVELWTDAQTDTSASLLGLPEEEDWVLYAPYSDKSLLRNVLAYKFGSDLGWYAPRTRLVELYLNDQYQGVYVLTEKIKRDQNRVNISTLNPDENSGDDLTGGYIVKLDKFDGATQGFGWDSPYAPPYRSQHQVIHFQFHYPKEDEITSAQSNYIREHITEFEHSLYGPQYRDTRVGYRNFINIASFIDFAIINELTRNVDGYRLSTFLYKDKDSKDGKLYLGPIWDFNLAFGNADYCEGGSTSGWAWDFNNICSGDWWLIPFWWRRLLRDPEYVIQFQNRWTELRSDVYSNPTIMNYIDSMAAVLDQPQQRNFSRWPILNNYIWPNNYVGGSYANEINYLKNWINNRLYWLDSNIAALDVITGIEDEFIADNKINVFPNPNNGNFSININGLNADKLNVIIINQLGEIIIEKILNISEINNNTLSFSELNNPLAQGVYLIKITDYQNLFLSRKLVVQ